MSQPSFSTYGAVDLSSLCAPAPAAAPAPGPGAVPSALVVRDVTEASFQTDVIELSMTVPVLIDFWAEWCGPCKQLSPVLERLAVAAGGAWVLAKVDTDANQRLGQAFQVQSIPSVFAVLKGQPLPLFQGALPEAQVRQYIDEVLKVATANGVTGRLATAAEPAPDEVATAEEPPLSPELEAAYDAIDRGDYDAAAAAYGSILAASPADEEARIGLAQVELLRRVGAVDETLARKAAIDRPGDVAVQCDVADLDLLAGDIEGAFNRLVDTVRRCAGADRETARTHLVGLFDIVGPDDQRVISARRALASALF